MANFPSSPSAGHKVTLGSTVYEYTGVAWKAKGSVPSSPAWSSSPEEASLDGHAAFKKQSAPSATADYAKIYSRLDDSADTLFHFNDNLVDSSGNGNNGSIGGGTPTYAVSTAGGSRNNATCGKAIFFDGNDFATFPDPGIGTGDFTAEFFVNFQNSPNSGLNYIWGYANNTTQGPGLFQIYRYNTVWYVLVWDHTLGTPAYSAPMSFDDTGNSEALTTNTWYHIAIVRKGANLSFYKDGDRKVHLINHPVPYIIGGVETWSLGRIGMLSAHYANDIYMDEFYLSKEARYSGATYEVPTAPYVVKTNLYAMDSLGNEIKLTP